MDLDRQQIERRDFPIVRRGYDPATVDAHLRALAGEIEELANRAANSGGSESLAAVAGSQVQGILEAAQATAETIEREAAQDAQNMRAAATEDARRTREEAIAKAQEHVAAVSQATDGLLARIGSMDSETHTLIESLRSGATQLAGDLTAVETNMEALYDAAAGRTAAPASAPTASAPAASAPTAPVAQAASAAFVPPSQPEVVPAQPQPLDDVEELAIDAAPDAAVAEQPWEPPSAFAEEGEEELESAAAVGDDLEGPRLVALNMALNGDSREVTARYLEENFEVADRERLLDEVYAAIEG